MMLRPVPTRWFELLTSREDLSAAVEALARTAAVELETQSETTAPAGLPDMHLQLEEYAHLARRYQSYWPRPDQGTKVAPKLRVETMGQALNQLHAWRDDAEPKVLQLEHLRAEETELKLLFELLSNVASSRLDLDRFSDAGPALAGRLFVLPPDIRIAQLPPAVITQSITTKEHCFLFALGPQAEVEILQQELGSRKARRIRIPRDLGSDWSDARRRISERMQAIDSKCRDLIEQIAVISERHRVGSALADIERLEWFIEHAGRLPVSENFGWVTGWTSDPDGAKLRRSLDDASLHGLLRLVEPPLGKRAPSVMRNPWWASPFEFFAKLLGTPGGSEVDPSPLLAILVPLLFGYMFGDIGQGAVLLIAGIVLAQRFPPAKLLIAGGAAAIMFGFAFGSFFSREDIIEPLWLNPLEAPLPVLAIPLIGGVIIIMIGLILNAVEASWRGEIASWWRLDAALLTLYCALVLSIWRIEFLLAAIAAVLWYLSGVVWESRRRGASFAGGLGHLFESTLQLAVNTVSFARVGAFALAHAGVSLAIVSVADTSPSAAGRLAIMVIGNLVVIVLEGLVVFIQTTRLVLFEFFIRFLRGEGRVFRPLKPPSSPHSSNTGRAL